MVDRRKLPVRVAPTRRTVRPLPDECLPSIAVRYAEAVKVSTADLLTNGLSLPGNALASLPFKPDAVDALTYLARLDRRSVRRRGYGRDGTRIRVGAISLPDHLLDPARRRLAPGMMRTDTVPHVRLRWQLRCLPCDPVTGEWLTDHCEGCGKTLTWMHCSSVAACTHCGRDVREVPERVAPPDVRRLSRIMAGVLRLRPGQTHPSLRAFAGAPPEDLLALFDLLGRLHYRGLGLAVEASSFATVAGLELALGWPGTFDTAFGALVVASPGGRTEMGPLRIALAVLAETATFGEALRAVVADRLRILLAGTVMTSLPATELRYAKHLLSKRVISSEEEAVIQKRLRAILEAVPAPRGEA